MIRHTKINTRSDRDPLQFFKNDYRKFYERYQTIRSPYESLIRVPVQRAQAKRIQNENQ